MSCVIRQFIDTAYTQKKSHQKCKAWLHVLYRNFFARSAAPPPLLATLHFWREDSIKFYYVFHYEITPKQHMPRPIRQMYSFVINRLWRRRRRRGTFVFCCYKVISLIFWPHVATSKKTEASAAAAATLYSIKSTTDYWHISTFFCFYSIETTGTVLAHIELIYGEMTAIALMAILFYWTSRRSTGWLHLHLVKIRPWIECVHCTKKGWGWRLFYF